MRIKPGSNGGAPDSQLAQTRQGRLDPFNRQSDLTCVAAELLAEATKQEACQVRSKVEDPCPRRAEVEILGVPFCAPCARRQDAYFAIGELTRRRSRETSRASRWPRRAEKSCRVF